MSRRVSRATSLARHTTTLTHVRTPSPFASCRATTHSLTHTCPRLLHLVEHIVARHEAVGVHLDEEGAPLLVDDEVSK